MQEQHVATTHFLSSWTRTTFWEGQGSDKHTFSFFLPIHSGSETKDVKRQGCHFSPPKRQSTKEVRQKTGPNHRKVALSAWLSALAALLGTTLVALDDQAPRGGGRSGPMLDAFCMVLTGKSCFLGLGINLSEMTSRSFSDDMFLHFRD